MNKIFQVTSFEIIRTIKKPSFWIASILVPILLIAYCAVAYFAGYNTETSIDSASDTSTLQLGLYDGASYLKITKFTNSNNEEQEFTVFNSADSGMSALTNNQIDILYVIPNDFATSNTVKIYNQSNAVDLFSDYSTPIQTVLFATASSDIEPIDYQIISNAINYETTTLSTNDAHELNANDSISQMIAPGIGLAMFYILIVVLGNRLTSAVVEEKENRISELLLTNIHAKHLIIGKIISLMVLGIIQLLVLVLPAIILLLFASRNNLLPSELLSLNISVIEIIKVTALVLASYFLFTSLCVLIGTFSSTAKDANSYSSVIVILTILPIFFMNTFIGTDNQAITYILSYFPPSAPLALLIRDTFNNLPLWEYFIGLIDVLVTGLLFSKLATYIFCRNTISFTAKIDFKKLLGTPRTSWKK